MPKFFYIARNKLGGKISGVEDVNSQDELVGRLQSRDLVVVDIIPEKHEDAVKLKGGLNLKFKPKHSRITQDDMVLFCRQLATLLSAGVTILKSLDIISRQVASRKLRDVIKDLEKNMEAGLSLHETMAKHPKVFSNLWVNLVESGEASGNLAVVLTRLANYFERNAAFLRKVISAVIYPAILFCAGLGALLYMTLNIVPTFTELFQSFKIELPALTRGLMVVSVAIRKFALVFLGAGFAVYFLFKKYIRTKYGRKRFELFLLKLPVAGEFFRALIVERFSSEICTLIESGVPILYSLEIVEHSVDNLIMSQEIRKIKEAVRDGKPLGEPMEESGFFEPMVVQMVMIGEEIGELPQMFKKINEFYQEYVDVFLVRFTTMFEPFMLLFIGGLIAIIVVGMFLPVFKIASIG
jgi:type IV pilus assembly protein PilC